MPKYRIFILIAGLAILLLSQYKLIMPFAYKVVASDLFLVDSKDKASQVAISTPLSNIAFMHCNNYIKAELAKILRWKRILYSFWHFKNKRQWGPHVRNFLGFS